MGRHIAQGVLRAWWLDTADAPANLSAPSLASELGVDGIDLRGTKGGEALMDIRGFKPSASIINTGDYIDAIEGNIGGPSSYPQSSLIMYSDNTDFTIRDALAAGNTGFVVLGHVGAAVGAESQVFEAQILFNEYDPTKSQAVTYEVALGIAAPTKGVFAA